MERIIYQKNESGISEKATCIVGKNTATHQLSKAMNR
jgi:hypothetical protein